MRSLSLLAAAPFVLYAAGVEAAIPWFSPTEAAPSASDGGRQAIGALALAFMGLASLNPGRR
jgi:hypothetical protein